MEILKFENYSLKVRDKEKEIVLLINQNFSFNTGDVILITGPNGTGKSTIISDLTGYNYNYKANGAEIIRNGHVFYKFDNKDYDINSNEKNKQIFKDNYLFVSQDDNESFALVYDCFRSTLASSSNNIDSDVFDFIKKFSIQNCILSYKNLTFKSKHYKLLKNLGIQNPTEEDLKISYFLLMKTKSLSGGQAKIVNIMSNLIKYKYCSICFIDEPLNNLDYNNVRLFSNTLTKIHQEFPELTFVIVTHCQSIPIVNKALTINPIKKEVVFSKPNAECNSCFGVVSNGYYI